MQVNLGIIDTTNCLALWIILPSLLDFPPFPFEEMATLSNSLILAHRSPFRLSSGSSPREADFGILQPTNLSLSPLRARKATHKPLVVRAAYSDDGRSGLSGAGIFIGGFILGGLAVGTLSFMYAPEINEVLAGVDKKDLMRKLPKFIYDEEKALEKTRKMLTKKIEELNAAIDNASAQLDSAGGNEQHLRPPYEHLY